MSEEYYCIEEDLEETMKCLKEANKEIERLNKECDTYMKIATKKENIIKEVREKLLCYGESFDSKIHQEMQKELLEILDKGE